MKHSDTPKWYVVFPGAALVCVLLLVLPLLVKGLVVQAYQIRSASMHPTLLDGDLFLVDKSAKGPGEIKRGDIIIFAFPRDPSKDFVKRVIGLPGDTIEIRDKMLYIDGRRMAETYVIHVDHRIYPSSVRKRDNMTPLHVSGNALFVMGDNRDASNDSRFWGFVQAAHVKGRAAIIYWSWNRKGFKVRWERIGQKIH